jgi:hypothetical protein
MNRVYSLLLSIRLGRGLLRVVRTRRSKCTRSRDRKDERVACRYHASGTNVHSTSPSAYLAAKKGIAHALKRLN